LIVYVNGDSHSAGSEAVNTHAFANDDPLYWALGRRPHPDNLRASYGCELANMLHAFLECDAESASSNERIIRTTWEYLNEIKDNKPNFIVIGWSTWEREEWYNNEVYYQVTASGTDDVPSELKQQYKNWVINQTHATRQARLLYWHNRIYKFHQQLNELEIPHLFFNTYSDFSAIRTRQILTEVTLECPDEYDWGGSYIDPYNPHLNYYNWCLQKGFKTVNPNSYHFGQDAHCAWAEFLYQNYVQILLTQ
jgi:hypothetical protein